MTVARTTPRWIRIGFSPGIWAPLATASMSARW
jgi:hypothetical protein